MENKKKRWFPWQLKKGVDREIQELLDRIAEKGDDPRLHQRLAEVYLEKGRKDQAIAEFIRAAECHSQAGFYLRAIALYRRILRMHGGSTETLLRLAELYLINGLLGDALVQFRKVIQQYRRQGKVQEILRVLHRMVEVDSENLEVRTKYIEMLWSEGFHMEAFDALLRLHGEQREQGALQILRDLEQQIETLYEKLSERFRSRGNARDLESLEEKHRTFLQQIGPEAAPAAQPWRGGFEAEEDDLDVLELFEEPQGEHEETITQQLQEADIYAEQGLTDEAEALYRAVLDADPENTEAQKGLDSLQQRRQEIYPPDSSEHFRKIELLRETSEGWAAAEASDSKGQPTKVPEDAHVRYELAMAYKDNGLIDECITELKIAAQAPMVSFASHRALGDCYREKGDLERAASHYHKARKAAGASDEELMEVSYKLAQLLERCGKPDQALQLYQQIGRQDQTFRDIRERVKSLSS